jgi:endogenous inhibitor of DNA gyrase (YacG/DUF329 family)
MNKKNKEQTCPYCGEDVFVEETNIYKLSRLPDGKIVSKLFDTALSVSCSNDKCEADLRNWLDNELDKKNIIGIVWFNNN